LGRLERKTPTEGGKKEDHQTGSEGGIKEKPRIPPRSRDLFWEGKSREVSKEVPQEY